MPDDRGSDLTTLLLDACQRELSTQDAQNREFSIKAAACLVLTMTFLSEDGLYHLSSVIFFVIIIISILILIPWFWQRPFDVPAVIGYAMKTNISADEMASDMTVGYSKAIKNNWNILHYKSILLQVLYVMTSLFIGLTWFQFYPDFFVGLQEFLQD